jgi:membrane-bound metal-dependent hydrolase YbcI (DUF457 family)
MKGIAHFISGVTVASFCPWAVEAAQNGNPAFFILGAVAGILPDTVDFKFYRFFYKHDLRVEPYFGEPAPPGGRPSEEGISFSQGSRPEFPSRGGVAEGRGGSVLFNAEPPDPQPIADAVAAAVSRAAEGRPTTLKLSTIQLSADNWRQYRVKIDPEAGEVRVQFGPVVSTGQAPQPATLPASRPVGLAKFSAPVLQSCEPACTVDIFDGPSFKFTRSEKGVVEIDFLPWHRNWSHSLTVGAFLAGIAAFWTWQASVVIFFAYVIHVIEDQMGHMGSNLLFPFTKKRTPGLKIMHSGDAFPNFAGVWLCCLLIFWNVYKAIPNPLYHFSFMRFMMTAMIVPFAIFGAVRRLLTRAGKGRPETLSTEWNI